MPPACTRWSGFFSSLCASFSASKAARASGPGFLSGCTAIESPRYAFDTSLSVHAHMGAPSSSASGCGRPSSLHGAYGTVGNAVHNRGWMMMGQDRCLRGMAMCAWPCAHADANGMHAVASCIAVMRYELGWVEMMTAAQRQACACHGTCKAA